MGMDQELYKFRAIIGHQGPLLASDPDWKGSKNNVQVEWETGEITFEPLSIIAADDPVTCAAYAKENDLLALEGWRRFRSLAKKDKVLARAIKQSKIRQVRRSQTYMFGYLIPRNYSLWSKILATNFFLCNPRRTRRFCTRVGLAISEYHPIDEYKLQIA